MINHKQRRILLKELNCGSTLEQAALKSGMSIKTARKYRNGDAIQDLKTEHTWKTRKDPFEEDWVVVTEFLELSDALEAKTLFEYLQRENPGRYQDGQLRTLQRKVRDWKALNSQKVIVFPQIHEPGILCASDFTSMNELNITIDHKLFEHKLYHFVLTYSNWEYASICKTENFESLSEGFQGALFTLGAAPTEHLTDNLGAAVHSSGSVSTFHMKYASLMNHYRISPRTTNPYSPNENGDVEQSNNRLKRAIAQSLLLRGSSNFKSIELYNSYLNEVIETLNKGRTQRLKEEQEVMQTLPARKTTSSKSLAVKVSRASTVTILKNIYSVPSSLIGKQVSDPALIKWTLS